MADIRERYIACMVLAGVGDAMGYKCGTWEFCTAGRMIHEEMKALGGVEKLEIKFPHWIVSDDTVMHLATGDALVEHGQDADKESLYDKTAHYYQECMNDMHGRAPGITSSSSCRSLRPGQPQGYQLEFDKRGGGCGAAMRSMCIGLRYPSEDDLDDLISYAIEAGRMTHHHPTGYLGSLASALFVSYAIQGKPPIEWGAGLFSTLPKALQHIKSQGRYVENNKKAWSFFETKWKEYLEERGLKEPPFELKFPDQYDVEERDSFYQSLSYDGWGGASGHDAPMIAYDAVLGAGDSWVELCKRGILHGGDNDSTGTIAGALFGAMYGFKEIPECNYKNLEYRERLKEMGVNLYKLSHPENVEPANQKETNVSVPVDNVPPSKVEPSDQKETSASASVDDVPCDKAKPANLKETDISTTAGDVPSDKVAPADKRESDTSMNPNGVPSDKVEPADQNKIGMSMNVDGVPLDKVEKANQKETNVSVPVDNVPPSKVEPSDQKETSAHVADSDKS